MHSQAPGQTQMRVQGENNGKARSQGMIPDLQHFRGRGACQSFEMGLGTRTSNLFTHSDLHKPNMLVSAQFGHFWCQDEPRAISNSQDSPRPKLGGSHHLPPYSILSSSPQGPHPNGILSRDSQAGVPKFPQLGLLWLQGHITSSVDL